MVYPLLNDISSACLPNHVKCFSNVAKFLKKQYPSIPFARRILLKEDSRLRYVFALIGRGLPVISVSARPACKYINIDSLPHYPLCYLVSLSNFTMGTQTVIKAQMIELPTRSAKYVVLSVPTIACPNVIHSLSSHDLPSRPSRPLQIDLPPSPIYPLGFCVLDSSLSAILMTRQCRGAFSSFVQCSPLVRSTFCPKKIDLKSEQNNDETSSSPTNQLKHQASPLYRFLTVY